MAINPLQLPQNVQPLTVDFSPLGKLGDVYREAQNRARLSELGKGLADGTIDYRAAAGQVADMGDVGNTLKFLALDEQKKKQADELKASQDFMSGLGNLYSGRPTSTPAAVTSQAPASATPSAPVGVPAVAPPSVDVRPPVASTPKVWGDKEAEDAGIYDAPKKPVQVADATVQPGQPASPATPASGSVAMPSQNPASGKVMALIAASSSPRLPQAQREVAKTLLTKALDEGAFTSDQKEWAFAKSQDPNTPDFTTWMRANKAAGKTEVNIDTKGSAAFATAGNTAIAKRFEKLSEEGDTGKTDLALVGQLRDLGQVVQTGAPAAIQGWLAERGIKVGENVGAVEAYGAIIDKLTPQQRIPGSGATSDYEGRMFKNSLPTLMKTPGGNEIIQNTLAGLAQYKVDRALIAEKALSGELKPGEALKQLRELPSPYANFQKFAKEGFKADPNAKPEPTPMPAARPPEANQQQATPAPAPKTPVRVNSPDEARALPPGTPFIAPDGREFVR